MIASMDELISTPVNARAPSVLYMVRILPNQESGERGYGGVTPATQKNVCVTPENEAWLLITRQGGRGSAASARRGQRRDVVAGRESRLAPHARA